jgi:hypothetical protein
MVCRICAVAVAARVHRRGSARSLAGRAGTGGGPQALGAACLAAASCSPRMMCCTMPFTSPPAQNAFSPAPLRMMQCTFALASQSCTVRAGFTTQCSARGSACQALPVGGALALYSLCSVSDIVKFRAFSALGLPHAAPLSSIPHTVQLLNRKAGAALPTVATPRASRAPCLFSVATAAAGPTSYSTCGQHALSAQRSCKQQRAMTRRRVHEGPPPALAWSLRSRGTSSCSGCGQQSAPRCRTPCTPARPAPRACPARGASRAPTAGGSSTRTRPTEHACEQQRCAAGLSAASSTLSSSRFNFVHGLGFGKPQACSTSMQRMLCSMTEGA